MAVGGAVDVVCRVRRRSPPARPPAPAWIAAAAALVVTIALRAARGRPAVARLRPADRRVTAVVGSRAAAARAFRLPGFAPRRGARSGAARARAVPLRSALPHGRARHPPADRLLPALGLDDGALRDPFFRAAGAGPGVFFAVVFIPMTLHTALAASESWRAAWIFFATPASPRAHRGRGEELRDRLFPRRVRRRAGRVLELLLRSRVARRHPRAHSRRHRPHPAAARGDRRGRRCRLPPSRTRRSARPARSCCSSSAASWRACFRCVLTLVYRSAAAIVGCASSSSSSPRRSNTRCGCASTRRSASWSSAV